MPRQHRLLYILWLLFLLLLLAFGVWLLWEGLLVPPALRRSQWESSWLRLSALI